MTAPVCGHQSYERRHACPELAGRLLRQHAVESCALGRRNFFGGQTDEFWLEVVRFFDVQWEQVGTFWRRILHTAHHRTQLMVYLRMMDRYVPSTYGPTKDVTWSCADPTNSMEAAVER